MKEFLAIAFGAGVHDGLNPCIFMTCAVFIAQGLWLKSNALSVFWLRVIFVVIYFFSCLVFNFGPGQIIIIHNQFIFATKIVYFILGLLAFTAGFLFFKDWFVLSCNRSNPVSIDERSKTIELNGIFIRLIIVLVATLLGSMATLWPINNYILLLGNEAIIRAQWQNALPLIGSYGLVSIWPLWFVWGFLSIKNIQSSWFKIICSAVFFIASSCVIFIFK